MVKNCDNCANQDVKKHIQDCNTFGYPLFSDCDNWKPKNEKIKKRVSERRISSEIMLEIGI